MRTYLLVILIVLLFSSGQLVGQSGHVNPNTNPLESPEFSRWSINFAPLSMMDFRPRYRIGGEYRLNADYAFRLDAAFGNSRINGRSRGWGVSSRSYSLREIRPELVYYFRHDGNQSMYTSLEFFAIRERRVRHSDFYNADGGYKVVYYDRAVFYKDKVGLHAKLGVAVDMTNRFYFDFFGGIGMAARKIRLGRVENPVEGLEYSDLGDEGWHRNPGSKVVMPHLALGIRIGLRFR